MKIIKNQRGQASTEWTIATFIIIAALFVPFTGDKSAVSLFMDAVRTHHKDTSFILSLP